MLQRHTRTQYQKRSFTFAEITHNCLVTSDINLRKVNGKRTADRTRTISADRKGESERIVGEESTYFVCKFARSEHSAANRNRHVVGVVYRSALTGALCTTYYVHSYGTRKLLWLLSLCYYYQNGERGERMRTREKYAQQLRSCWNAPSVAHLHSRFY